VAAKTDHETTMGQSPTGQAPTDNQPDPKAVKSKDNTNNIGSQQNRKHMIHL